ncbi:hypothetical protein TNIN_438441 [Trichonephila inaurata madagascariensis]|uniref:Uncharacterized protein n=1 Tax=Trichonephila inaurata madagascariensis TaxID=2747483 RepID=A0A8X6WTW4_9ARAC|nr:hypothetical protein TNIN_438441 [Trichonephila inaurata madagascariensis]
MFPVLLDRMENFINGEVEQDATQWAPLFHSIEQPDGRGRSFVRQHTCWTSGICCKSGKQSPGQPDRRRGSQSLLALGQSRRHSRCLATPRICPSYNGVPPRDVGQPKAPRHKGLGKRFHNWRPCGGFRVDPLRWRVGGFPNRLEVPEGLLHLHRHLWVESCVIALTHFVLFHLYAFWTRCGFWRSSPPLLGPLVSVLVGWRWK